MRGTAQTPLFFCGFETRPVVPVGGGGLRGGLSCDRLVVRMRPLPKGVHRRAPVARRLRFAVEVGGLPRRSVERARRHLWRRKGGRESGDSEGCTARVCERVEGAAAIVEVSRDDGTSIRFRVIAQRERAPPWGPSPSPPAIRSRAAAKSGRRVTTKRPSGPAQPAAAQSATGTSSVWTIRQLAYLRE